MNSSPKVETTLVPCRSTCSIPVLFVNVTDAVEGADPLRIIPLRYAKLSNDLPSAVSGSCPLNNSPKVCDC